MNSDQNNETLLSYEVNGNRDEFLAKIEIGVLASLFVLILVSNLFVLVALGRSSIIRPLSRTYLFMLHISIADTLVGIFNVLPQLCWDITYRFQGPNWLCKAIKWLQMMPIYLSSLLLVFLAIDRYRAIIWRRGAGYALGVKSSKKVVMYMVASAWIGASIMALPQMFIFSKQFLADGSSDCWSSLSKELSQLYVVYYCVVAFALPLVLIIFFYSFILIKMWQFTRYKKGYMPLRKTLLHHLCCIPKVAEIKSNNERVSETSTTSTVMSYRLHKNGSDWKISSTDIPHPLSRAKLKTIRLTCVIVMAFIVCNAPFCSTQLYFTFKPHNDETETINHPLAILMLLLPSLPSLANPWIYFMFSKSLIDQIKLCFTGKNGPPVREQESIGDKEPGDRNYRHIMKLPCTPPEGRSPRRKHFGNLTVNIINE